MGAGGTSGGTGRFIGGLSMMVLGGYLFLNTITVSSGGGFGRGMYQYGSVGVPSGLLLLPLLAGVGMLFYNYKNPVGWLLFVGSLVLICVGIITSLHMYLRPMTLFDIILITGSCVGGVGLFLSSFRKY